MIVVDPTHFEFVEGDFLKHSCIKKALIALDGDEIKVTSARIYFKYEDYNSYVNLPATMSTDALYTYADHINKRISKYKNTVIEQKHRSMFKHDFPEATAA